MTGAMGASYASSQEPMHRGMKIACVMMQKDETILLDPWIRYHSDLIGSGNLYILDNGSTAPSVIRSLRQAELDGVHVLWDYRSRRDYLERGPLIVELIQHLDREGCFDFYFLLDCDEFLACQTGAGPSCQRQDIEAVLRPFLGSQEVLVIQYKYWHNPCRKNFYSITNSSRKCFFAHGSCDFLDHGFHHGRSKLGKNDQSTVIVFFEFHYKPYRLHRISSRQHLCGVLDDFSRRSLRAYRAKRKYAHHCAEDLLKGKYDFVRSFLGAQGELEIQGLLATFDRLGIDHGALFERQPPIPSGLWLFLLRMRQTFMHGVDGGLDVVRRGVSFLRRQAARRARAMGHLIRRLAGFP